MPQVSSRSSAADEPTRPPLPFRRPERPTARRLRFAGFELAAESGELFRAGEPVRLQPQPAKVLLYLASRPGELVARRRLQRHLWGDDHFVDCEQGLNYCIRAVRRALGDDAAAPRFVETVPRRGYRFVHPVELVESPTPPLHAARTARRRPRGGLGAAALLAAGVALVWAARRALRGRSGGSPERPPAVPDRPGRPSSARRSAGGDRWRGRSLRRGR